MPARSEKPKADHWISVADRLPTENSAGLLVTNNLAARDAYGFKSHVWFVPMLHEMGGLFHAFTDADFQVSGVTHWRYALTEEIRPAPRKRAGARRRK